MTVFYITDVIIILLLFESYDSLKDKRKIIY